MRWNWNVENLVKQRLKKEKGSSSSEGKYKVALIYPASYGVGMASLGFLSIFKHINARPDWKCERFFIDTEDEQYFDLKSYETRTRLQEFSIIAVSIAYEGEIYGLIKFLIASGITVEQNKRSSDEPLIIIGGPLTAVSPELLTLLADVVFIGESENTLDVFMEKFENSTTKNELYQSIKDIKGIWTFYSDNFINGKPASVEQLPAYSFFTSPTSEFGERVLIEVERGCNRGCGFCVMSRKSTGIGMRTVPLETIKRILTPLPKAVGLVGAAVTDHPQFEEILCYMVENNVNVSLSSMRADRLNENILNLLFKSGLKTLTVAADAPSDKIRKIIHKGITENILLQTALTAKKVGFKRMKLYQIIGYEEETSNDIEELISLSKKLSEILRLDVSLNPLVPKNKTQLANSKFISKKEFNSKLLTIKKEFRGKIGLQITPWKEAAWEYLLHKESSTAFKIILQSIINQETKATVKKKLFKLFSEKL